MKTFKIFNLGVLLLFTGILVSSCKKDKEPGPDGIPGKDGGFILPYKQGSLSLVLEGNYQSNGQEFSHNFSFPFYKSLDENVIRPYVNNMARTAKTRTSEVESGTLEFLITRRDSLNNSFITFSFLLDQEEENPEPYFNSVEFDVIKRINSTSYYRIASGENYGEGNFYQGVLYSYNFGEGNEINISDISYNNSTQELRFSYDGSLSGYSNSTGNELFFSGNVNVTLNREFYRKSKE